MIAHTDDDTNNNNIEIPSRPGLEREGALDGGGSADDSVPAPSVTGTGDIEAEDMTASAWGNNVNSKGKMGRIPRKKKSVLNTDPASRKRARVDELADIDEALVNESFPGEDGFSRNNRKGMLALLKVMRPAPRDKSGKRAVTAYFRDEQLKAFFISRRNLLAVTNANAGSLLRKDDSMSRCVTVIIQHHAKLTEMIRTGELVHPGRVKGPLEQLDYSELGT
jgi:hypothetical protein